MTVPLIVGGVLVLLAAVAGVLAATGVFRNKERVDGPPVAGGLFGNKGGDAGPFGLGGDLLAPGKPAVTAITKNDLSKLQEGMTLEEVEAILGAGKLSDQEGMKTAFGGSSGDPNGPPEAQWMNNGRSSGVTSWYQWRNDDLSIYVGFAPGKRSGKLKAMLSFWVERFAVSQGLYGFRSNVGFMMSGDDPDQFTDNRDAQNRVLDDPKWKKGSARQLLPGRWKDSVQAGYEFGTNSAVKAFGAVAYTGTYRFIDDDTIEITRPESQFLPGRVERYRVLVTNNELLLVYHVGRLRILQEYKRVK